MGADDKPRRVELDLHSRGRFGSASVAELRSPARSRPSSSLASRSTARRPARARPKVLRQLIPASLAVERVVAGIRLRRLRQDPRAICSWPRLAVREAFEAIFVRSIATTPTLTSPAPRHRDCTEVNSSASAVSWRRRNSAIVEWSGTWFAQIPGRPHPLGTRARSRARSGCPSHRHRETGPPSSSGHSRGDHAHRRDSRAEPGQVHLLHRPPRAAHTKGSSTRGHAVRSGRTSTWKPA
jgi:hypothetical protein